MVADEVTRLVPGRDQFGAVGVIHSHPANEKRGADIFRGNSFQDAAVGFLPFQDGAEGERGGVERERELRAHGIIGRSFWGSALRKRKGSKRGGKELRACRGRGGFHDRGEE